MSFSPVRVSIIAGALLATSLSCSNALSSESPQDPALESVKFSFQFNRADLASEEGANRMLKALVSKARKACTSWGEPSISLHRTDTQCVAQLVQRASDQVGAERLAYQRR
jgi:UrcA family protein